MRTLVWFRGKDLRLSDHEPLWSALKDSEVITLFVLDPYFFSPERAAELPHRMQFLLQGLESLRKNIAAKGGELLLARGKSHHVLPRLCELWQVDRVVAQRWTEPFGRLRDKKVKEALRVPLELYEGETLLPPESVRTQAGAPFSVYTPFARAARAQLGVLTSLPSPKALPAPPPSLSREGLVEHVPSLKDLSLTENPHLLSGGERAANSRLRSFRERLEGYDEARDLLAESGTSRISADLKFGLLSPRSVILKMERENTSVPKARYLSQLLWREFAYACLWDRPSLLTEPFRADFKEFPWSRDEGLLLSWKQGRTGYPVVDAASRQLLREGFVHNRARMIAASFLTKHLLVHYAEGEAHYLKYLTDGDWAVNNMGWQWSAGCGVDAQPYFRVFNPTSQGQRFDPEGLYVKRYLPELSKLPTKYIHEPWTAPSSVLRDAGIRLGTDYPLPIVDHKEARARFLALAKSHVSARKRG